MGKNVFINDAQSFSANFSDSGLFGIKLAGSASHINEIINVGAKAISGLRGISQNELELAKASLKITLGKAYNTTWKKLEDRTKAQYYTGSPRDEWKSEINNVTLEQVQGAVSQALQSPLTLVAQGGQVNEIGSYDKISQLFN